MATVNAVILPIKKRKDGTWNVKIRVNKDGSSSYIETTHFVNSKQVWKKNQIKDPGILAMVEPVLTQYRKKIGELGAKLDSYSSAKLVDYLVGKKEIKAEEINVIDFGRKRIEELMQANRLGSAKNMQTVVNSLVDFFRTENVFITDIRSKMLYKYEAFLLKPRIQIRPDQFQRPQTRAIDGLSNNGLHNHIRDLRILFNCIKEFYNDEDDEVIVVKHYPFKKYKLPQVLPKDKPKLTIAQVVAIRDFEAEPGSRIELARDLFMLSFYLCGMNAVDMYKLPPADDSNLRISYNRSKTASRRRDQAYISIFIPEEARSLYTKYAGTLQKRYASHSGLDHALAFGIKKIGAALGHNDPEFYDARHAFGDFARNRCRFSMDDVGLAMNHKDQSNRVTDIYVSKNWDIIDEVQSKVISLLPSLDSEKLLTLNGDDMESPFDLSNKDKEFAKAS
ncbi:site-specific integrase [Mucilaginibacter rubeus]|uniref:Site-specific integrase n=1 Tax=Mucilaginibacter rubeus TaxID=2027860 RepID=A0AAE6MLI5_9SPHI|nr:MULTISPECIES: site-specific integrase [Mucilaginibacter]QEM07908.1 site-specific integrase [Mucilaginibacter rubeus]QEM20360.1 site-specific integrase [Mucilaginibacter gossypii]QTE42920.1 site-specific integrase [Mucilaginibacter rubeus]QTE49521.1 site-specific integrase [Mucilaginibacter rubeus]QTE54617.1 site-specific integrase [Mucilaginibacter rubeus]